MSNEPKKSNSFVSRGGIKLQAAVDKFQVNVKNKICLDVGCSTGGFTDCLLQNGAQKVYAVDTAYGELAWTLRQDPRVVVMERTNILNLSSLPPLSSSGSTPGSINSVLDSGSNVRNDNRQVDLITIDAGWTKLEFILPIVKKFLKPDGKIIALLKPHYEANKTDLIKGILPENLLDDVKNIVVKKILDLGFKIDEEIKSPILGGGGNTEYLLKITF